MSPHLVRRERIIGARREYRFLALLGLREVLDHVVAEGQQLVVDCQQQGAAFGTDAGGRKIETAVGGEAGKRGGQRKQGPETKGEGNGRFHV